MEKSAHHISDYFPFVRSFPSPLYALFLPLCTLLSFPLCTLLSFPLCTLLSFLIPHCSKHNKIALCFTFACPTPFFSAHSPKDEKKERRKGPPPPLDVPNIRPILTSLDIGTWERQPTKGFEILCDYKIVIVHLSARPLIALARLT